MSMSPVYMLLIGMIMLLVGINLAANNTLHSYIVKYVFYDDKMSYTIIRFIGLAILGSVLLLILGMQAYALVIVIISGILFIFLSIRGRSRAQHMLNQKRIESQRLYNEEIKRRRMEIDELKKQKREELEKDKGKSQSISDIKKKMWDDGSMTNQDLIKNLKK